MSNDKNQMEKTFGEIFKQYRKEAKYTQEEMAEKLEITSKYVSRVERGDCGISRETLTKYINFLGISPNVLYKDFITNPKVKREIEVSEKISGLSDEKMDAVLEIVELIRNL